MIYDLDVVKISVKKTNLEAYIICGDPKKFQQYGYIYIYIYNKLITQNFRWHVS